MFVDFRERGGRRGRERERERLILIGCLLYTPQKGIEPATQICALAGNQTLKLLLQGVILQPTKLPSQGSA